MLRSVYLLKSGVLLFLGAELSLLNLLLAKEKEGLDLLGQGVLSSSALGDALATNESCDDAGADNEGQDESVHAVPVGSKSTASSTRIVVVEESEGKELSDQSVLDGEQQGGPGDSWSNASGGVSSETVLATISSPLQSPVDGSQEGQDL